MAAPRGSSRDLLRAWMGQVKQEGRVVRVNIDLAEDVAEKLVEVGAVLEFPTEVPYE